MRALLGLLFAFVMACTGTQEWQCDAETPCGFGEVCIQGQCISGRCSTSAQCAMEQYCSNRECVPGCQVSEDCYPGSSCNQNKGQCEESGCVETHVDCGFREFCNAGTGECYDAGSLYCQPCNSHNQCAGAGNLCLSGFCGVDCSSGKECPAGFDCFGFMYGSTPVFQCWTACELYEDYEPGSFVQPKGDTLDTLETTETAPEAY